MGYAAHGLVVSIFVTIAGLIFLGIIAVTVVVKDTNLVKRVRRETTRICIPPRTSDRPS
jgi:hypothetical protein